MTSGGKTFFQLAPVLACMIFVFLMGISSLKNDPLANGDEYRTLAHIFSERLDSPQPLPITIANVVNHSEQHGPLYFILLNVWSRYTGDNIFTLRLLSACFGLLTMAAVYRLGLLTGDRHLALAAVFILALNWLFLFYTRELRMYTFLPFFTAWIVWSYWRLLERPGMEYALSLAVSAALILYVHYFGIFILASVGIYHLLFVPKNKRWLGAFFALVIGGLMFLPWLPTVIRGLNQFSQKSFSGGMTAGETIINIASVFSNDFWLIPAGCLLLIIWNRKRLNEFQRFLLMLALLAVTITVLANELTPKPFLLSRRLRYLLVFAPMLTIGLAIGWRFLPKRAFAHLLMIGIWLLSFIAYYQDGGSYIATKQKSMEVRNAPPFYAMHRADIDIGALEPILSLHLSRKITYITATYYQHLLNPASLVHLYYNGAGSLVIQATKKELASLDQFVANYASFWLIYNPHKANPQTMGGVFQWMHNYYRSCGRTVDNANEIIERFVRDSDPC